MGESTLMVSVSNSATARLSHSAVFLKFTLPPSEKPPCSKSENKQTMWSPAEKWKRSWRIRCHSLMSLRCIALGNQMINLVHPSQKNSHVLPHQLTQGPSLQTHAWDPSLAASSVFSSHVSRFVLGVQFVLLGKIQVHHKHWAHAKVLSLFADSKLWRPSRLCSKWLAAVVELLHTQNMLLNPPKFPTEMAYLANSLLWSQLTRRWRVCHQEMLNFRAGQESKTTSNVNSIT